jgi:hypothetical protein
MHSQNISYGTLPYGAYTPMNSQIYSSQATMMQDKENIAVQPIQLPLSREELTKTISSKLEEKFKKVPQDITEKTMLNVKNKISKDSDNMRNVNNLLKGLSKDFTKQMNYFMKTYNQINSQVDDLVKKLGIIISHYIDIEIFLKKAMKSKQLTEAEAEELKKISELCDYKQNLSFMEFHKNVIMQENISRDLRKLLEEEFGKLTDELIIMLDEGKGVEKYGLIKETIGKIKTEMGKKEIKPLRIESKSFDINQHLPTIIQKSTFRHSLAFYK